MFTLRLVSKRKDKKISRDKIFTSVSLLSASARIKLAHALLVCKSKTSVLNSACFETQLANRSKISEKPITDSFSKCKSFNRSHTHQETMHQDAQTLFQRTIDRGHDWLVSFLIGVAQCHSDLLRGYWNNKCAISSGVYFTHRRNK